MQRHDPGKCLNCGAPVSSRKKLFCGERCHQLAELVRYARRKLADSTFDRSDVAEAITIRLGQLAEGFYDKRARQVSEKERHDLMTRSNGRCEKCGCYFTPTGDARFTVQHIWTANGLRIEAWCYRCNMDDAKSRLVPAVAEHQAFFQWFDDRIHSKEPVLLCDDPDSWPTVWRELQTAAKHAV